MNIQINDIDRIDLKILACLQEDGRISNLKLAEIVSLSPTAVLARVQRLTKDGYLLGYQARLNRSLRPIQKYPCLTKHQHGTSWRDTPAEQSC